MPQTDAARPDALQTSAPSLERFTFESPVTTQPTPPSLPSTAPEEQWEPEIVFSDLDHTPPPLTHTVSSGPDAPEDGEAPHEKPLLALVADEPAQTPVGTPGRRQKQGRSTQEKAAQESSAQPELPLTALTPDLPAAQGAAGKEDPAADLSEEQAAIYARLRDWRNTEAKRQEISRFIIASNATLAEIARRVPYTDADLKAVKGMGPERMKKYGEQILSVVRG